MCENLILYWSREVTMAPIIILIYFNNTRARNVSFILFENTYQTSVTICLNRANSIALKQLNVSKRMRYCFLDIWTIHVYSDVDDHWECCLVGWAISFLNLIIIKAAYTYRHHTHKRSQRNDDETHRVNTVKLKWSLPLAGISYTISSLNRRNVTCQCTLWWIFDWPVDLNSFQYVYIQQVFGCLISCAQWGSLFTFPKKKSGSIQRQT